MKRSRILLSAALALACCLLLPACASAPGETAHNSFPDSPPDERETDELLQRAAQDALGEQDGTIIVLDPQLGRIRAIVNERVAYAETLPPGSTAKPFTMLAALEANVVDDDTRLVCRNHYRRGGVDLGCSHPRLQPAFSPSDALAHSCNYFHATFGEQMPASTLARTLTAFGFDRRTNSDDAHEATGVVPHDAAPASLATGEAATLKTTPLALIAAYTALINGGRLLTPQRSDTNIAFNPHERTRITIADTHRRLLLAGMRGAVTHGTATPAELNNLPLYIVGKTGTATAPDDTRPHGWFIAFAADREFARDYAPARLRLAVLVLARKSRGSDAAQISRSIFEEYAKSQSEQRTKASVAGIEMRTDAAASSNPARTHVRVRLMREARTFNLPLDEYLFGVLAAEASTETEPEALKAQAIVSRTYALHNLSRHGAEGYDLCDLTHCQRFVVADKNARGEFYDLVARAIEATAGEFIADERNQPAETYFSASCGGHTANITDLWGTRHAPKHLRGFTDSHCAHESEEWIDDIPTARLLTALRTDARSDTGARLDDVRILRRDASGRAAMILLVGDKRRTLSGWAFKSIIGRALGWSTLKSTRFRVERNSTGFRFRGQGFGHGLGLCQTGAHNMARRGATSREILHNYFPGTHIARATHSLQAKDIHHRGHEGHRGWEQFEISDMRFHILYASSVSFVSSVFNPALRLAAYTLPDTARRTLSSETFRLSYPASVPRPEAEYILDTLERARASLAARLSAASLPDVTNNTLTIFIHVTTQDFTHATGSPPWVAAITRGDRIHLQPPALLRRRGVLTTTLRHELAHTAIEKLGRSRAPLWLAEGLAAHVADEGRLLTRDTHPLTITTDELERRLAAPASSASEMHTLYAEAYRRTSRLIREEGESRVWRRIEGNDERGSLN